MRFPGLILVDGSSYLYRAFHALPPLTNAEGLPTGAIFGVVNMLRRLLQSYHPSLCAVVFDAKGPTFRHELYENYKAHRPPMPDELKCQVDPLLAIIKAMGFPLLMIEGVEADDVIGTLATQAAAQSLEVLISTGDKDFAQLVNDRIKLTNTMSNTDLDALGVAEKFGIKPEQMIDYLILVGDSSDHIPGVPSVGPKTAAKWLQHYQTLENLMAHADEIKGKVGERFREHIHQFSWVRELVTICCTVPLDCAIKDLQLQAADNEMLKKLYQRFEFKNFLKELLDASPIAATHQTAINFATENVLKRNHEIILTREDFQKLLTQLKQAPQFSIDTETTGLDIQQAELVGMSFALNSDKGYYLPFIHRYLGAPTQLNRDFCLQQLKPILADETILKILQHAKFDMNILADDQIELKNIADTQLESYVLQSQERHDLDSLAEKYLHYKTIPFEAVAGKGVKQITFDQIDLEQAAPYAAEDAQVTYQLHQLFAQRLANEPGLLNVLNKIEIPLVAILAKMERYGVLIDAECLRKQSAVLEKLLLTLQAQAYQLAGQAFNLNSPKQLQEILFGQLNIPSTQKTPTGQPSTSEEVLQELAYEYELPKIILSYRSFSKLKSTYTDKLPQQISGRTGRIHTSYHQAIVPTGRLSSSNPNLQNIPIRSEEGKKIRQAFIAPPGCKILAADYSQVELRIMAHLSQDKGLLQAFQANEDIHRATASEVFNVPLAQVTGEERRQAKAINFGLMYGMSAFGLAKQLHVNREVAQAYITAYFARYPGVKDYMERTRAMAHELGYVETIYGRRLYLSEIHSRQALRVKASERAAINGPLQGSSADIIKRAMITIDQWLSANQLGIHMVMQVHDELVFEVPESEVALAQIEIPRLMSAAAELLVPLLVDVDVGDHWGDAH
jgi:DNA polymerase-1